MEASFRVLPSNITSKFYKLYVSCHCPFCILLSDQLAVFDSVGQVLLFQYADKQSCFRCDASHSFAM